MNEIKLESPVQSKTFTMSGTRELHLSAEEAAHAAWRSTAGQVDEWTTEEILEREA
jgi:hypothetical protein